MAKVAVIGGGSTYTPELVSGFLARVGSFPLSELWLMDVAAERLALVGGFARRMVRAAGEPFRVELTGALERALEGASYVITQLRVGGMAARREDEYLGLRHGLIGQETTGVGGMAKGLRTIPVILAVARSMQRLAPGALLANFTNPSGLVTEALSRHVPEVPAVGVCNVAVATQMELLAELGEPAGQAVELDTLGLNHLSWHRGLRVGGRDVWAAVLDAMMQRLRQEPEPEWDGATIESLGMIPNHYLQYYYYAGRKLAEQQAWPPSRAEEVMAVERDLLRQYAEPDRDCPPPDLMKRGGAYYSTVATQLLDAHWNDRGEVHVADVKHGGAVRGWPEDWVLELPCRVDAAGIHPLPAEPLPPVCAGLLAHVKAYELLTVQAAVEGDRRAAYQALLAHPLGPSADQVQAVLDDLLETNRRFLPQFWRGRA